MMEQVVVVLQQFQEIISHLIIFQVIKKYYNIDIQQMMDILLQDNHQLLQLQLFPVMLINIGCLQMEINILYLVLVMHWDMHCIHIQLVQEVIHLQVVLPV